MNQLLCPQPFPLLKTPDDVEIQLTRFRGGDKGPLIVVPGVSVRSGMFTVPTVKENFVQFLVNHGYDVWLLDWRGSNSLPLVQFTLDEAAENDFPAAVKFILSETKKDSVQAVVHCVGAIAFFMSLQAGKLPEVRCVACSQIALHPRVSPVTQFKTGILHLAKLISDMGMKEVSPIPDPKYPLFSALLGGFVNLIHHECDSTVCHRMSFMYGHMYPHNNVNLETHERQKDDYGPCNVTTLRHLEQCANRGFAAKFDHGAQANQQKYGSETPPSYVDDAKNLKIPITLVSGDLNNVFVKESTLQTYKWLCEQNGPSLYTRTVIPDYGHFDNFVGAQANKHCYPAYLEQLEKCP
jgi:pimeloyl-ACP methyl ester carboxylesterase